jgi:hypothetical protein
MKHAAMTNECTRVQQDITLLIQDIRHQISRHLEAVKKQRSDYPDAPSYCISEEQINYLFEKCALLRENGEQIDFITYSKALDQAETLLKKLRAPIQFRRSDILGDLSDLLTTLEKKTTS